MSVQQVTAADDAVPMLLNTLLLLKEVGKARLCEKAIYSLSRRSPQPHNTNM